MNIFANTFQKLAPTIEKSELSNEEKSIFVSQIMVWFIASALEMVKILLVVLIKPKYIDVDPERTMYGKIIVEICKALEFEKTDTKHVLDNFMVELRNAIFHNKYDITVDGFSYLNYENKVIQLTHDQVTDKTYEADAIYRTLEKFANERVKEMQILETQLLKRAEELEKMADELEKAAYEKERKAKGLI